MIITDKLVFIHSPRTGGNSFEDGLINCGIDFLKYERHTGARFIKKYLGEQKFYFTVRNPFDQLISRYEYAVQTNLKEKKFEKYTAFKHWLNEIWSDDIEIFLQNYISNGVAHITEEFKVIADYDYVILLDYEKLNEQLNQIMKQHYNIDEFVDYMPKTKNSFKSVNSGKLEGYRKAIEQIEVYVVERMKKF